ncbi:hypothetical protein NQ176_g7662 [Zarea fungicola]|uniref:Uncharacterized protein n=1 Tax=Zarea fungicola TaxID=93591 RepID=A0ACC1MWW8_9HYPO|nr:hypothetical protein NQ176_g7662 [Lecanicillium fungicola]
MAFIHDGDNEGTVPKGIPVRKQREGEIDGSFARSLDSFSRSLPSAVPFLEAEPQPVLLPHDADVAATTASSTSGRDRVATSCSGVHRRKKDFNKNINERDEDEPSETSPLLGKNDDEAQQTATEPTAEGAQLAEAPLYLNGVSSARFWFVFGLVQASLFIGCFDSTLMASSHPVITSHFKAANSASWLSTSFLLASTAFQPLLGRLSDSLGRKPLFIGSVGVLALATAWCGLATSLESFIIARAFCGLGAGGSMALGSIITSDLVPIE